MRFCKNIKQSYLLTMKQIIICLIALGLSVGALAQNNEFGIVVGGFNGLSYKKMISENFAIQTDLAVGFQRTAYFDRMEIGIIDLFDFVLNPNFLFNKELNSGLYAFVGGGVSLGLAQELLIIESYGKFGVNAMLGAGYKFQNFPISLSLDFRPGYGMLFHGDWRGMVVNTFDWHLAFSARYCF